LLYFVQFPTVTRKLSVSLCVFRAPLQWLQRQRHARNPALPAQVWPGSVHDVKIESRMRWRPLRQQQSLAPVMRGQNDR
jgi:hypothetical protein